MRGTRVTQTPLHASSPDGSDIPFDLRYAFLSGDRAALLARRAEHRVVADYLFLLDLGSDDPLLPPEITALAQAVAATRYLRSIFKGTRQGDPSRLAFGFSACLKRQGFTLRQVRLAVAELATRRDWPAPVLDAAARSAWSTT